MTEPGRNIKFSDFVHVAKKERFVKCNISELLIQVDAIKSVLKTIDFFFFFLLHIYA